MLALGVFECQTWTWFRQDRVTPGCDGEHRCSAVVQHIGVPDAEVVPCHHAFTGTLHDTSNRKEAQVAGWSGGIVPPRGRPAYCGADSSASTRATAIHAPASPRIPPAATARVADHGCSPMSSKSLA